jgi:NADPH2:quinone reductase
MYEDLPLPVPGPGQARVKIAAAGVNFIDVYHRTGLYKLTLPFSPGMEAAGVVDATGEGVTNVSPGDRVAYAMNLGSYAEYAIVRAWQLVKVPEKVGLDVAAAAMLQGMTAHYLMMSTFPLQRDQTALVHAAAGGVGLLMMQIGKMIGATVIGTVSTGAKADLARGAGASHVILYQQADFEAEVKKLTGGRGVDVVYDSVGRTTYEGSLNCLRPRGMLVLFGQSSGSVPPLDPGILATRGSLFMTRPTLAHYTSSPEELAWRAGDILRWIDQGKLHVRIDGTYPLKDAGQAHRALESRATAGKLLLRP